MLPNAFPSTGLKEPTVPGSDNPFDFYANLKANSSTTSGREEVNLTLKRSQGDGVNGAELKIWTLGEE